MARCVYIHVPFCLRKCAYCDFLSIPHDEALEAGYVKALSKEIRLRCKDGGRGLDTLYIGGGTPTILSHDYFGKIFGDIRERFDISPDTEVTVEANPGTVGEETIQVLGSLGVNRISLGVQSLNDAELETLGRTHTSADAFKAVAFIREGLKGGSFSLDLMYGIPGQTLESWKETLAQAGSTNPGHVSAYELTLEQETPLHESLMRQELRMPEGDTIADMYHLSAGTLKGMGFRHYEISNYALPGYECRHNMNYWRRGEYLGFGVGAHSFIDGRRMRNIGDITGYIETVLQGFSPVEEEHVISGEDALMEEVFLGLRTEDGLEISRFSDKYGYDIAGAAGEMIADGLIEASEGRLRLTERGMLLSNPVIIKLLDLLDLW